MLCLVILYCISYVMLCYVVLYYIVVYYSFPIVLNYTMLCYIVLNYIVLYFIVFYYIILLYCACFNIDLNFHVLQVKRLFMGCLFQKLGDDFVSIMDGDSEGGYYPNSLVQY